MSSRKRQARERQREAFERQASAGLDDAFAREELRREGAEARHEAALRAKACESKQRYATRLDAERTARDCERHGSPRLHSYCCSYCGGWHLTHKPPRGR